MNRSEYIALVGSFILVGLEALIRILTLALRMYYLDPYRALFNHYAASTVISLCYRASRRLFNRFISPTAKTSESRKTSETSFQAILVYKLMVTAMSSAVRDASDFVDLCALYGYYAEEHVVQTGDGYLLALHRLAWRKGEEDQRVNHGPHSIKKNVVYMHHGLLMNSEVWVCLTDEERCLPFKLVEKGYDVWVSTGVRCPKLY